MTNLATSPAGLLPALLQLWGRWRASRRSAPSAPAAAGLALLRDLSPRTLADIGAPDAMYAAALERQSRAAGFGRRDPWV